MGTSFEFQLGLTSNFAAALAPTNRALGDAEKHLDKAKDGVSLFEAELGKASGSLGGFGFNLSAISKGGSIFTFDLAEGAKVAYEAISHVVDKTLELGKEFIHLAAETQELNLAVRLNVGEAGAKDIQDIADSFKNVGHDDDAIKRMLLPLLDVGIKDHDTLANISTAATDIAARRGEGKEALAGYVGAFEKIAITREVSAKSLKVLGVNEQDFYKDLGNLLHVSDERAKDMVKSHKVAADTLLSVALNQVAAREGGALGNASLERGKTLGATLERLGDLAPNLFKQLADSPGIHAVQGVLDNFVEVLGGPTGAALVATIGDAFNDLVTTIFGDVSGPDGIKKMRGAVEGLGLKIKGMADGFREAWPEIKKGAGEAFDIISGIAKAMAAVAHAYMTVIGAAEKAGDKLGDFLFDSSHPFEGGHRDLLGAGERGELGGPQGGGPTKEQIAAGARLAQGLANGMEDNVGLVSRAATNMANVPGDVTRDVADIHSPSALFDDFGRDITRGFANGIDAGASDVSRSTRAMASDLLQPYDAAAPGAGGGGSLEVNLNFYTSSTDAHGLADEVAPILRVELKKILVEAGYAYGAGRSL